MNKIISFSLWGKNPKYLNGALLNIPLQKQFYPDWKCRFFVDNTVPIEVTDQLKEHAEVLWVEPSDGNYGLFWRFYCFADLGIERFIVRDTDSRLNEREADAVREWEESGLDFHIMRDHKFHNVPICGGMFGATVNFNKRFDFKEKLTEYTSRLTFQEIYKARGKYWNCDQPFLWKYVWPRVQNTHIAHIKDLPELRLTGREKLFKVSLPDNHFVGEDINV